MKRLLLWAIFAGVPAAAIVWWVSGNTYWTETTVPMPPKGEARTNPFYAAQRFAEALGARTAWDRAFTDPGAEAVIVLSGWHWTLSPRRREALERWVESGGRLVVDGMLVGGEEHFAAWSGIVRRHREHDHRSPDSPEVEDPCRSFEQGRESATQRPHGAMRMCDVDLESTLAPNAAATWTLTGAPGIQAMRVPKGRGSVTFINAVPFRSLSLFDGDHGWLLVSATQLRRGDAVHFLSEDDHPSLLALAWQQGAPVVALGLALAGAWLWRHAARFGPLAAERNTARRSLAEQIRGTGLFAWRTGGGESLHAACVRALDEAAARRIPGYARLSAKDRAAEIGRLTGFDWSALAAAIHHPRSRRIQELRTTIALLEAARRRTLERDTRDSHG